VYSRRVVPFGGQITVFSHRNPQTPPPKKKPFWGTYNYLGPLHISVNNGAVELKFGTLVGIYELALCINICPLGGVWGDQQPLIFILKPPPYLRN